MATIAIHPGEHLGEELRELGMSAAELARKLDVSSVRHEVLCHWRNCRRRAKIPEDVIYRDVVVRKLLDALINAAERNYTDKLRVLLAPPGIRLDDRGRDGATALMTAKHAGGERSA